MKKSCYFKFIDWLIPCQIANDVDEPQKLHIKHINVNTYIMYKY